MATAGGSSPSVSLVSDAELRALDRRWRATGADQDEAAWLAARVRGGALEPDRLALAAGLGHPAAVLVAAPLADPFAGRDPAGWKVARAFLASHDARELLPLLSDPGRGQVCAHEGNDFGPYWRHRLCDVVVDERAGECYRLFRCWACAERVSACPIVRSCVVASDGWLLEVRGLPLLDVLELGVYDPGFRLRRAVPSHTWVCGLGAHGLEVNLRAAVAAIELALDHDLPDPSYRPPPDLLPRADRRRPILAAFLAWLEQPDPERADELERRFDEDDDGRWVTPLYDAVMLRETGAEEWKVGAAARRALHWACLGLGERVVVERVRAAVVPWALA